MKLNNLSNELTPLDIIKGLYDQYEIKDKMNKIITKDNIKYLNNIIKKLTEYPEAKASEDLFKYYPYVMFLILTESISITQLATTEIYDYSELKQLALNWVSSEDNKIKKEISVYDLIKNVYYGRTDVRSYKDEDNIKSVMENIYNELNDKHKELLSKLGVVKESFYNYFIRINDLSAKCEDNIQTISYILNMNQYSNNNLKFDITPGLDDPENTSILLEIFQKISERTIYY